MAWAGETRNAQGLWLWKSAALIDQCLFDTRIGQGLLCPPVCSVVLTRTVSDVGPHAGEILPCKVGVKGSAHHAQHTTHHAPHTAHPTPHSTHHTPHSTPHTHTHHTAHHTPHLTEGNTTKSTQSPNLCSSTCFVQNKQFVLIPFFLVVFQAAWGWPNCTVLSQSARNVFH